MKAGNYNRLFSLNPCPNLYVVALFNSYPVVKLTYKDGYTWIGKIVGFADKYPSINKTRVCT